MVEPLNFTCAASPACSVATTVAPWRSSKLPLPGFTASSKLSLISGFSATPVAASAGMLACSVGAVVSGSARVMETSSMARPWSLPTSLSSTQRSHSVAPGAQPRPRRSPPTLFTRPAALPSTAAAVPVATGDCQL
ncbi:conserved hypothetical protein, partial [Ricinus communis]